MKYQVSFFCIFLVGRLVSIDLSALLSDTSQSQPTVTSKKTKKVDAINLDAMQGASLKVIPKKNISKSSGVEGLTIFSDPDYQSAMNILNDQNKSKIYEAYINSIKESFITYYLMNVKTLKKIKKRQPVIDLSNLEQVSNQDAVQKKVKKLPVINLSSLTDITGVKKIKRTESSFDLSSLLNTQPLIVTKKVPVAPVHDLSILKNPKKLVSENTKTKPLENDLGSLLSLNQENSTVSRPAPVKSNKKMTNLASLINN